MRIVTFSIVAAGVVSLAGCGCLEKYTDPRLDDGPIKDGDGWRPRGPSLKAPDPYQPAWHKCVFGTRWLSTSSAVFPGQDELDRDQPAWHRRLFGPRYIPRDRLKDDARPMDHRINSK